MITIDTIISFLGGQIVAVLALIAANFVVAVGVAIQTKTFYWAKIADFYRVDVVPKLFGWLAATIIVKFVAVDYLPADWATLTPAISTILFGIVVLSLFGNIMGNLLIIFPSLSGAASKVGIVQKEKK